MDAQITNGIITSLFSTIGAAAVTGYFVLRAKEREMRQAERVQAHAEHRDGNAEQNTLLGGYKTMWQDAEIARAASEARRISETKRADDAEELNRRMRKGCNNGCGGSGASGSGGSGVSGNEFPRSDSGGSSASGSGDKDGGRQQQQQQ